jgi:hypothetical protein
MKHKQCRRCGESKPLNEFHREVRTGRKVTGSKSSLYKSKCIPCENEVRLMNRKKYVKDNKPKKSSKDDMKWAFSRVLEGVFYNRPNRKAKEEETF